jgi:hypothetical protein
LVSHYFADPFVVACISLGIYRELNDIRVAFMGFSVSLSIVLGNAASDCWYKAVAKSSASMAISKGKQKRENGAKKRYFRLGKAKWVVYYVAASLKVTPLVNLFLLAGLLDTCLGRIVVASSIPDCRSIVICCYAIVVPLASIARIAYSFHRGGIVGRATILE